MNVDRKTVLAAVRTVLKGVSSRPGLPALTGIRITTKGDRITLLGTDLEVSVSVELPNASGESWEALVPAKLLAETLKVGPDAVSFGPLRVSEPVSAYGGTYRVETFGAGATTLRCLPLEDFPTLAPLPDMVTCDLEGYVRAATAVLPACSQNELRPVLTGMLHETGPLGLTLVATDSYRLHTADVGTWAGVSDRRYVVPGRAVKVALGVAGRKVAGRTFELGLTDVESAWRIGNVIIVSRLIEGDYPNWQRLLPDNDAEGVGVLTFETSAMLDALAIVAVTARDTNPVRIELNGKVELRASSPDIGETTLPIAARWSGDDMSVAFNPTYLSDALKSTGASVMYVHNAAKPCIAKGPGGTGLVMPVRMPAVA